jgi:hypothetical protein
VTEKLDKLIKLEELDALDLGPRGDDASCARLTPPARLGFLPARAQNKKGQGKSIRRLALTFILKQNAEPCVSPSRTYRIG